MQQAVLYFQGFAFHFLLKLLRPRGRIGIGEERWGQVTAVVAVCIRAKSSDDGSCPEITLLGNLGTLTASLQTNDVLD